MSQDFNLVEMLEGVSPEDYMKQQQATRSTQRALALEVAKGYCTENGLSYAKLCQQRFNLIYDEAIFSQPSDVVPDGLRNDLATQPKPTLIIKNVDGVVTVKETEYTKQYLTA